jgi:hypothetical protein
MESFSSICSNFLAVSSIALLIFHSKNSELGSSLAASLLSALAIALSVALAFSSFFSLAHHFIYSLVCLLYGTHLVAIKELRSVNLDCINSFFSFS